MSDYEYIQWSKWYFSARTAWEHSNEFIAWLRGYHNRPLIVEARDGLRMYNERFYRRPWWKTEELIKHIKLLVKDIKEAAAPSWLWKERSIEHKMLDSIPELEKKATFLLKKLRPLNHTKYDSVKTPQQLVELLARWTAQEAIERERGKLILEIGCE